MRQFLALLAFAVFAAAAGCGPAPEPDAEPSTKAPAAKTGPSGPQLTLADSVINFGQIDDFETREVPVFFTNTGNQVLTINRVQPTCGCTTTKLDKTTFAPGKSGEIKLKFTPKGSGPQTKYVKIHTNDPTTPVTSLAIKSTVRQTVASTPRTFAMKDVPLRQPYTTTATLRSSNPNYTPTSVAISGDLKEYATASMTPLPALEDGTRRWTIQVALNQSLPWGWHTGTATVRGTVKTPDGVRPQRYAMGMSASVYGSIRANDPMFRLITLQPRQNISKTIQLSTNDGTPFQIASVLVQGGGEGILTAAALPMTPDNRAWIVSLTGTAPRNPGIVKGHVIVRTNLPGEEAIGLLYSGNVVGGK